jgi:hypothetical protein
MPATKALSTIIAAATSNAAAGTTTGTAVNLTTAYGGTITGLLTNGATGPTVQATATVQISGDNVNWKTFYLIGGDVTISLVTAYSCDIPPGVMYARVVVTGNTGQPVTCEAFMQAITAI